MTEYLFTGILNLILINQFNKYYSNLNSRAISPGTDSLNLCSILGTTFIRVTEAKIKHFRLPYLVVNVCQVDLL